MTPPQKKRVLHLIDSTGQGGAEKVFLYIIKNLGGNYKFFVILPDKGWLYEKIIQLPHVDVILIDGSGRANFSFVYKLIQIVLKNKITIVHSHLFGTSVYASLIGIICQKTVICTFHGFIDTDLKDPLLKLKFFLINNGAKKIISVSDHLTRYIENIIGRRTEKCTTIYNGIPLESGDNHINSLCEREKIGLSKDDIVIGSVGNIKHAKGYAYLIKAAKLIHNQNSRCKFIIAGFAEGQFFDDLIKLRNRLSLEDTVKFIGYQEDVNKVFGIMDIFMLPSLSEGFSLATIEAMAREIPVIVTESGGPQEIVKNNFSGLIVKVADENALAKAVIYYLNNPSKMELFTINAKKNVYNNFSIKNMITKYKQLYETFE